VDANEVIMTGTFDQVCTERPTDLVLHILLQFSGRDRCISRRRPGGSKERLNYLGDLMYSTSTLWMVNGRQPSRSLKNQMDMGTSTMCMNA